MARYTREHLEVRVWTMAEVGRLTVLLCADRTGHSLLHTLYGQVYILVVVCVYERESVYLVESSMYVNCELLL